MNTVSIALTYNDSTYTFSLLEYQIHTPFSQKISYGQLVKLGVNSEITITGRSSISGELYNTLTANFKDSWNNSTVGSAIVTYSLPSTMDGNLNATLTFEKAVLASIDVIKDFSVLDSSSGMIFANISLSLSSQTGLNQYYTAL